MKLLVGLYTPASGGVLYNDISTEDFRYNTARRQIGLVTQPTHLFAGTIRENICFVKPDTTDDEIIEAMQQAACAYLLDKSPGGLDTMISEMGMKLSGGERQRLSIARALIRRPPLLIFDEATSALDSLTEVPSTVRSISARKSQITMLIAHRLSTLHDGLVALRGLYYAMWRQQIGERPALANSSESLL